MLCVSLPGSAYQYILGDVTYTFQSILGTMLSKSNLSSAVHHNRELFGVKQRVDLRICQGASMSKVSANPLLLLLKGSSQRREAC